MTLRNTIEGGPEMERVSTLVEFFSDNTIENVLGAFAFLPEQVIFLIDSGNHEPTIQDTLRALERRLPQVKTGFYQTKDSQLESIRLALEELYRDHPDCVFDFTGGAEPMLLAAYSFAFRNDAPMLHIHMQSRALINIHRCGQLARDFVFPQLALEDLLNMHGAFLSGYGYPVPEESWNDTIRRFCTLVMEDQHKWKEQCLFLQMAAARAGELRVCTPKELRTADGVPVRGDPDYLHRLAETGMLTEVGQAEGLLHFRFPTPELKHCLCDSGVWLELYTYLLLKESGRFSDVRLSVRIGWGESSRQASGTAYNEIDIIACAGITPLFISCKSGLPNPNNMNEILVYARKFGGQRARAAMVTSAEISTGFVGLRKRAEDLGMVIVDESDLRDGLAQGMLLFLLDSGL